MPKSRFYPWLRRRFGIVLPNTSRDYIESFFKWVSYNGAIALAIRAGALLTHEHQWLALIPMGLLFAVLTDLTASYGARQLVKPILDIEHPKSRSIGLGLGLGAMVCLQIALWFVYCAFALLSEDSDVRSIQD